MLYQTFSKIREEAELDESIQLGVQSLYSCRKKTFLGNMLEIEIQLNFFEQIEEKPNDQVITSKFFRQIFTSVAENTYSCNIMRNIDFLLVSKLVS
jgi:hypothetical protein